ncbi:hypothetical protein IIB34_04565 [PVC group bacterium]|nr:hypothetical protein [PVC group bacterium]
MRRICHIIYVACFFILLRGSILSAEVRADDSPQNTVSVDRMDHEVQKLDDSTGNVVEAYRDEVSWLKELRGMLEAYRKILGTKNTQIEELHEQMEEMRLTELSLIGQEKSAEQFEKIILLKESQQAELQQQLLKEQTERQVLEEKIEKMSFDRDKEDVEAKSFLSEEKHEALRKKIEELEAGLRLALREKESSGKSHQSEMDQRRTDNQKHVSGLERKTRQAEDRLEKSREKFSALQEVVDGLTEEIRGYADQKQLLITRMNAELKNMQALETMMPEFPMSSAPQKSGTSFQGSSFGVKNDIFLEGVHAIPKEKSENENILESKGLSSAKSYWQVVAEAVRQFKNKYQGGSLNTIDIDKNMIQDVPGDQNASLPEVFQEIPRYPLGRVVDIFDKPTVVSVDQHDLNEIVQMVTQDQAKSVYEWYRRELPRLGWSIEFERVPGVVVPGLIKAQLNQRIMIITVFEGEATNIIGTVHHREGDS